MIRDGHVSLIKGAKVALQPARGSVALQVEGDAAVARCTGGQGAVQGNGVSAA
jgi:hypothetical protein